MYKIYIGIFILFLASCTSINDLKKLNKQELSDADVYNKALAHEYEKLSKIVFKDWMWSDSEYFMGKSKKAHSGKRVLQEDPKSWNLPESELYTLIWGSDRLDNISIDSVKEKYPERLAHSQALLDCWIERVGRKMKIEKIEECRMDFILEMASLENILMPVAEHVADAMTPEEDQKNYYGVVYFPLSAADVDAEGMQIIDSAINSINGRSNYVLEIAGYTSGSDGSGDNENASNIRVETIAKHFTDRKIDENHIEKKIYNKLLPTVRSTEEGCVQHERRIEIRVKSLN